MIDKKEIKMKRIAFLIGIVAILFIPVNNVIAAGTTMTNAEFAEVLVGVVGIPVPPGTENLSDEEYFEVLSNILATAGINDFVGLNGTDPLSQEIMTAALYGAIGGPDNATYDEKIAYLSQNGFDITSCFGSGSADSIMVLAILNNPAFATLVAEAYSPPDTGAGDRGFTGAPGVVSEGPATTI